MLKLLLLLVVALLAVMWFTKGRLQGKKPTQPGPGGAPAAPGASSAANQSGPAQIVACAHCGVHLPQADALTDSSGHAYCGEPHRLAGKR
jgi:uncharacterized protein